ncbi:hypothetical protein [Ralstonia phage RSP15]|uniref:hypothetical protein n=1 Tax=Ralstonia phage RSP15 TaxID=1785960 RepID=UPI00074D3262|nr:hypothetical protein BH754_gp227 [Ralstonia phage RSP15]BAU40079.1 hypothetical protein [Ralstonia phage RSP15]
MAFEANFCNTPQAESCPGENPDRSTNKGNIMYAIKFMHIPSGVEMLSSEIIYSYAEAERKLKRLKDHDKQVKEDGNFEYEIFRLEKLH